MDPRRSEFFSVVIAPRFPPSAVFHAPERPRRLVESSQQPLVEQQIPDAVVDRFEAHRSSSQAAAVAAGTTPGVAGEDSSDTASDTAGPRILNAPAPVIPTFQWYHGLVFVPVTLVFVPLGLGTMQALPNTKFFVFVPVCVVVYSGYKLLRQPPSATRSMLSRISSFRGRETSSSWS